MCQKMTQIFNFPTCLFRFPYYGEYPLKKKKKNQTPKLPGSFVVNKGA